MKFVYTTCTNREEAQILARGALESKLAVCADMWEIESLYSWNGETEDVTQMMLMFTTNGVTTIDLETYIRDNHTYQVPMVGHTDVAMSQQYQEWAQNQIV